MRSTDHYLQWEPARHTDGCTADGWDVRTYTRQGPHPQDIRDRTTVQVAIRAVCPTCGTSYELAAETGWPDPAGGATGPWIDRSTTPVYGHQVRPIRVREYWLHAQGHSIESQGHPFSCYYLTRSRRAPASAEEVLGVVGTRSNRLGNLKWTAATTRPSQISALVEPVHRAEKDFTAPMGAAHWIAKALANE